MRFQGQHALRCCFPFLILLSPHLVESTKLKHARSFKESVNIDGKIFSKDLPVRSSEQGILKSLACFAQRKGPQLWLYVITENSTHGRQSVPVFQETQCSQDTTLILEIVHSRGGRVGRKVSETMT